MRSKDFSLSHDDVLLYVGGKNEDARVVLFTEEDRTKAFSECHASKSGGHQGRDRTEDKLRHYYWPHMHLDIRHWVKDNITKAQNSQIATDLKRKGKIDIKSHVSVGDKVLVRNRRQESRKGGKLTRKYLGPFTVKTISDKGQV
ncbi:hypothetical protein EMCRGX_G031980 [Ephydatia muelleri]